MFFNYDEFESFKKYISEAYSGSFEILRSIINTKIQDTLEPMVNENLKLKEVNRIYKIQIQGLQKQCAALKSRLYKKDFEDLIK